MTVLGISASPRISGNTDILLDELLSGAKSKGAVVGKVRLADLNFEGCRSCGGCDKSGACVLNDDMRSVYKKIGEADYLIVASPIFFGSVSSQLKAMIDRFHCIWVKKNILKKSADTKKKGVFLSVSGANEKKFFENAKYIIRLFFNTIDVEYSGEIFCGGVDAKGAIKQRKDVLKTAFDLGASF